MQSVKGYIKANYVKLPKVVEVFDREKEDGTIEKYEVIRVVSPIASALSRSANS
jgi:hypothetical protein